MSNQTRLEHDLLGEKAVPADAYYGVQTARGLDNFHISGVQLRLYPDFIKALAMVKMAAARANHECGQFSAEILKGIEGACQELIDGKLHDQFTPRHVPGRRRHLDQHERQRGHRQPGARADGTPEGRIQVLRSARPRECVPVHERRLSHGAARRHGAWQRAHGRGDQSADRVVPDEGAGVRSDSEDGPDPAAGCGTDDAWAGVQGVRGNARGRSAHARSRSASDVRGQHGRDGHRHRPQRAGGLRRRNARRTWPRSPGSRFISRPTWSKRRRTPRRSCCIPRA